MYVCMFVGVASVCMGLIVHCPSLESHVCVCAFIGVCTCLCVFACW